MDGAMKRQHVSRDELLQVVRSKGMNGMSAVGSVIMESDGSFSVLPESQGSSDMLLSSVSRHRADSGGSR